jgi:hypothetical protein
MPIVKSSGKIFTGGAIGTLETTTIYPAEL